MSTLRVKYLQDIETEKKLRLDDLTVDHSQLSNLNSPNAHDASAIGYQLYAAGSVNQSVADVLGNTVSVDQFGAVGDGVSDDQDSIQNAINYLVSIGGGKLMFGANKLYSITRSLITYSHITLDLNGSTIRRDFNTSPLGKSLLHIRDAIGTDAGTRKKIAIINGTLDGNGQNYPEGHNITGWGSSGAEDVLFYRVDFLNNTVAHAIDMPNSKRVYIIDCNFLGFDGIDSDGIEREAIQLDPGTGPEASITEDIYIIGCYCGPNPKNPSFRTHDVFVGNHSLNRENSYVRRVHILNNTVEGANYAAIRPYAWDETIIRGNSFINCRRGVRLSEGTASKKQGCRNLIISENNFLRDEVLAFGSAILIDGTGDSVDYVHENIQIINNTIHNNHYGVRYGNIVGLRLDGNVFRGGQVSLSNISNVLTAERFSVKNNTFDGAAGGIYISSPLKLSSVKNNMFLGATTRAIYFTGGSSVSQRHNIDINGNIFKGAGTDSFITIDSGPSSYISVEDNKFIYDEGGKNPNNLIKFIVEGVGNTFEGNKIDAGLVEANVNLFPNILFNGLLHSAPTDRLVAAAGSEAVVVVAGEASKYMKTNSIGNTGWIKVYPLEG